MSPCAICFEAHRCAICAATSDDHELCALCAATLARFTGAIPGGLVAPYLYHYVRHQAAMKAWREK